MTMSEGTLYEIWKLERRAWLEGPAGAAAFTRPDALVVPPDPMPIQDFAGFAADAERAEPFTDLEMADRHFVQDGQTVVIAYTASAKHRRYRRRYTARCMTVYRRTPEGWRVIAHDQSRQK